MKVLDLRCTHGHGFEGWFASADDFAQQLERGLVECPMCGDQTITRMPSAPRLNLSGARTEPQPQADAAAKPGTSPSPAGPKDVQTMPAELQAAWVHAVRHLMAHTEDVGERFAEEARRIHYGEKPHRGIRGHTTEEEREALHEEGIEVVAIPVPSALKGPVQ